MARYSKVDRRIWNDEKFRSLSPLQPCGQALFLYLLTNPFVGPIPGLYSAGEAMMAEALNWELKGFQEAFQKAFREGLVKADFEARLVWLPNAVRYNQPENPNVVIGWGDAWDELPECPLKREAWEALRKALATRGSAWIDAFTTVCPEPSSKGSAKGMPKASRKGRPNQEQEQEQEQEEPISSNADASDDSDLTAALQGVWDYYLSQTGRNPKTYSFTPTRKRKGRTRLKECLKKTGTLTNAVELMKEAINRLVASDWHMGRDPKTNGKTYCDWDSHLFSSYERMEKWWNQ